MDNKKHLIDLICKGHCKFYKESKEEDLFCEGFKFFERLSFSLPDGNSDINKLPAAFHHDSILFNILCKRCDFLVDGCDYRDKNYSGEASPCGGFILMNRFLKLSPHCSLKILEKPYLYDIKNDELYELDKCAEDFIKKCNGINIFPLNNYEDKFINFCLKENLLEISDKPKSIIQNSQFTIHNYNSPIPSLRYLELQLTRRCNLSCKHCYLGKPRDIELSLNSVKGILKDFEDMQGLRLLISGGEPLLYSYFWEFNEMLPDYNFRKVLLTNGWFLKKEEVSRLNVHEVQVSLDGLEKGHDMLRGKGSFKMAISAMDAVKNEGIDLSVATMVHPHNINDFMAMADILKNYNLLEWGIDIPLVAGNLKIEKDFVISPEKGAEYLKFAFGGSYHGGSEGYACGRHICTIMPSGKVCKCGFYEDQPLGNIEEGLIICWERNYHIPLKELQCHDCLYIEECQGGCRFRAETSISPDPIMCAFYKKQNLGTELAGSNNL